MTDPVPRTTQRFIRGYEGEISPFRTSTNGMLDRLRKEDDKALERIDRLFDKYSPSIQLVNIRLSILAHCIQEKNNRVQLRIFKSEKQLFLCFSDDYIKKFWELMHLVFQSQTFAQSFTQLVDGLKPKPMTLPPDVEKWSVMNPSLEKFQKELNAFKCAQERRYECAMGLNTKVQRAAKAQIDEWIVVIQALGLYEQTVANGCRPLCFLTRAFSSYYIRLPPEPLGESKKKEGKRRGSVENLFTSLSEA